VSTDDRFSRNAKFLKRSPFEIEALYVFIANRIVYWTTRMRQKNQILWWFTTSIEKFLFLHRVGTSILWDSLSEQFSLIGGIYTSLISLWNFTTPGYQFFCFSDNFAQIFIKKLNNSSRIAVKVKHTSTYKTRATVSICTDLRMLVGVQWSGFFQPNFLHYSSLFPFNMKRK